MKRVLGRLELLVAAAFLALLSLFRCATSDTDRLVHATQIGRRFIPGPGGGTCLMTFEYRDATGALFHEELQVTEEEYRRFAGALYVCMIRTLDGVQLRPCD